MKINKLFAIMGVGALAYLSTFNQLTPTQAALTAPASYDIGYQYVTGSPNSFRLTNGDKSLTGNPRYTRTADGAYYNYTTTALGTTYDFIPDGLDITMTFNRSNSTWSAATPNGYWPTDTKIGSDNSVGGPVQKFNLRFDNQTNKNYSLWLDFSSSPTTFNLPYEYDDFSFGSDNQQFYYFNGSLLKLHLFAYSSFDIWSSTSNARYLDGWYLKDLGVSAAYNEGFDDGEVEGYQDGLNNNPNLLLSGFQAMVGILVNFALMVLNLSVFGVSLLDIFSILALLVGVIWILKLVRG